MSKIKISIITAVFNNVDGLQKTIESILGQTYTAIEHIIIDGGSTDGTVELLKSFGDRLACWISEKDNGIYHAQNKGWRKATGDYCLFLNSGDYLYQSNVIERCVAVMEKEDADVYYGDLVSNNGKHEYVESFTEYPSLYYLNRTFIPHPSSFIRFEVLQEFGGYSETYKVISDKIFFIHCVLASKKFKLLQFPVTFFELGGISTSNNEQHKKELLTYAKEQFPFLHIENEHFKRLRYYEMSRPHRLLEAVIRYFKRDK